MKTSWICRVTSISGMMDALLHQKNHITQILRLFTQTDANVASNYCDFFILIFKNNEIRCMLLARCPRGHSSTGLRAAERHAGAAGE